MVAEASPLVVFADDWGRHPSSCQHLVRRLRKQHPVLWVNTIGTRQVRANSLTLRRGLEKVRSWARGLTRVSEQMWVLDLPMLPGLGNRLLRDLNRSLVTVYLRRTMRRLNMRRPVVLTTLPYVEWLIRDLARDGLVYYCTDDYSHWPAADRETLIRADREMSRKADLILAVSRALVASHAAEAWCEYFPHAVDFAHFAAAQREAVADDLASLPSPRIGFFGLIYEKLDFRLLTEVALRFQEATLVLIGPVAYCPPDFANLPNVRLLGARTYQELPRYIAGLDVLLLPYVDDEMIRQSSPLKLRECLASGRPTVSVDVPEVRAAQPHVRVGATPTEFMEQVDQALQESPDLGRIHGRQAAVRDDTWDRRAEQFRLLLARSMRPGSLIGGDRSCGSA
jgi:glycosyltransferase involved in cell wall biosynthesis